MNESDIVVAMRSASRRDHLARLAGNIDGFRVVARASDMMSTFAAVEDRAPSVVLIDECFIWEDEFEVMKALFAALDVRWLAIRSARRPSEGTRRPTGAADLFSIDMNVTANALGAQLRSVTRSRRSEKSPAQSGSRTKQCNRAMPVVLIGASTGGVDALIAVLSAFPIDCPPTVIVQHTGARFGHSLASLLDRHCAAAVRFAEHGTALSPGLVLVGAGLDRHVTIDPHSAPRIALRPGDPINGHRPSVDALFQSAVPLASRCHAALLTGMGQDGAAGLKALKDHDAFCIAQDQATSVVFGMPKAAIDQGAPSCVLPLGAIGPALLGGRDAGATEANTVRA